MSFSHELRLALSTICLGPGDLPAETVVHIPIDRWRPDGLPFVRLAKLADDELVIRDDSAVVGENQELESDRGHRAVVYIDHLPLNLHGVVMGRRWPGPAEAVLS